MGLSERRIFEGNKLADSHREFRLMSFDGLSSPRLWVHMSCATAR